MPRPEERPATTASAEQPAPVAARARTLVLGRTVVVSGLATNSLSGIGRHRGLPDAPPPVQQTAKTDGTKTSVATVAKSRPPMTARPERRVLLAAFAEPERHRAPCR